MASNQIVVDLNKDNIFNGKNYDTWQRRVILLLTGRDLMLHLTQTMEQPVMLDNEFVDQHRQNLEAYNRWVKKDHRARIMVLSSMNDDLRAEYYNYSVTKESFWWNLNH